MDKNFAEIVPLLKLPKSLGVFDYAIPPELKNLQIGQLVKIPWRQQKIVGLVINLKATTEFKQTKELIEVINYFPALSANYLKFLTWFKNYYLISWPTALKTALPEIKHTKILKIKTYPDFKNNLPGEIFNLSKNLTGSNKFFWQTSAELITRHLAWQEAIKQTIAKNKQVLIIVPSALALAKVIPWYQKKFADKLAIINSQTASGQHTALWQKIFNQEVQVILGTRLAVFSPFDRLGLIIIDNSQNQSLKQWDLNPRYETKTLIEKIAELTNAKIIYSDLYPDLNLQQQIIEQKIKLITEPQPIITTASELVDLKEQRAFRNYSLFGDELLKNLANCLTQKTQAILFINKRGLASNLVCRDCGYIAKCSSCQQVLTLHEAVKNQADLFCHYCGQKSFSPSNCPKCHGTNLKSTGAGTQKVQQELSQQFPTAKILRLDADTNQLAQNNKTLLVDWLNHKYDFLVATQALLDFALPQVATTAVINAESLLNQSDFNAAEKTFYLINFIRSLANKKFFLQTYNPENEVIKYSYSGDWENFSREQLALRKEFNYPPFWQYLRLISTPDQKNLLKSKAEKIQQELNQISGLQVFAPERIYDHFWRWQIIIKKTNSSFLTSQLIDDDWLLDID
ncbi:MAG: primosomal protein N' [Candidatus Buchananbacteria bacterium]